MNDYEHRLGDFSPSAKRRNLPAVYVLATPDFEYIKVGKSTALKQRMINVQSGCPFDLSLWLVIRTPRASEIEAHVHQSLNHCHVRGEWFNPAKRDLDRLVSFFVDTNQHIADVHAKANINEVC